MRTYVYIYLFIFIYRHPSHPSQAKMSAVAAGSELNSFPLRKTAAPAAVGKGGGGGVPPPSNGGGGVMIGSRPTLLEEGPLRFLIMDAPRQANLHLYIQECQRHGVTDLVRVCEPTYLAGELEAAGIALHEMAYDDGTSPPPEVLEDWLGLVDRALVSPPPQPEAGTVADGAGAAGGNGAAPPPAAAGPPAIAVHCVAGLGRAPVLVAIALVEFAGMDPVEAVTIIRRRRRGAINEKQLNYLGRYRRSYRKGGGAGGGCCAVS